MNKIDNIADKVKLMYQSMKATYIPDTYAKVSMYLPIMASMELSTGKSISETLLNRTLVTGTDLLNGIITGIACDYMRRKTHAENQGLRQKIVDTVTSIAVLDTLYLGYQYIACQITDRPTYTLLPACLNLALILLFTGAKYGRKRNDNRKDYSIEGNTLEKTKNMIRNDYYRIKNWIITDLNYGLLTLS